MTELEAFKNWCVAPEDTFFYKAAWEAWQARAALPPPEPAPPALSDDELARIAYKGFDDYWAEDSAGKESEAWAASARAVLTAERDCRLCANYTTQTGGCVSVVQCADSMQFRATAPRQYWIAGPSVQAKPEEGKS